MNESRMWITRDDEESCFDLWAGSCNPTWRKIVKVWRGDKHCTFVGQMNVNAITALGVDRAMHGPSAIVEVKLTQVFPNELECVCSTWAGELIPFRGPHHVNCKWHGKDELAEAKQVIRYLLCAMRNWAGDEDGVHPDAVLAYDRAALFVGEEKLKVEE